MKPHVRRQKDGKGPIQCCLRVAAAAGTAATAAGIRAPEIARWSRPWKQNRHGGTLAQWASRFAMSERNRAAGGQGDRANFRRWRHQLQLILALQMLVRGLNVQQVALSLGYDSTTAFITMFRKGLGKRWALPGGADYDFNKQRYQPAGNWRAPPARRETAPRQVRCRSAKPATRWG